MGCQRKFATRAVDQFIARLRKIIERDPADPQHLVTIRDAGYRFLLQLPYLDAQEDADSDDLLHTDDMTDDDQE